MSLLQYIIFYSSNPVSTLLQTFVLTEFHRFIVKLLIVRSVSKHYIKRSPLSLILICYRFQRGPANWIHYSKPTIKSPVTRVQYVYCTARKLIYVTIMAHSYASVMFWRVMSAQLLYASLKWICLRSRLCETQHVDSMPCRQKWLCTVDFAPRAVTRP